MSAATASALAAGNVCSAEKPALLLLLLLLAAEAVVAAAESEPDAALPEAADAEAAEPGAESAADAVAGLVAAEATRVVRRIALMVWLMSSANEESVWDKAHKRLSRAGAAPTNSKRCTIFSNGRASTADTDRPDAMPAPAQRPEQK